MCSPTYDRFQCSIIPKLMEEAHAKKSTVSTHKGETYHFCYFFKKTEPYSFLIKQRHFVAVPAHRPNPVPPIIPNPPRPRKRVRKNDSLGRIEGLKKKKPSKRKGKVKATEMQKDEDAMNEDEPSASEPEPRRSERQRRPVTTPYNEGGDTDEDSTDDDDEYVMDSDPPEAAPQTQIDDEGDEAMMIEDEEREPPLRSRSQSEQPGPSFMDLEVEEEEMKPKPQLQLSFNGFNIFGRCLCVIVEPWPVIRAPTEAPQSSRMSTNPRTTGVVPDPASGRGQTPLFLPDDDDRGVTPAPAARADRPPVPLFHDPPPDADAEDDEEGDMILFSELLSATGGSRVDADDEDGFDGAILFGDADERKEIS